jgi:hypothetical protein
MAESSSETPVLWGGPLAVRASTPTERQLKGSSMTDRLVDEIETGA